MNNAHKSPKYTYQRHGIYYFSRAIPADLKSYYSTPRIVRSLKTTSLTQAKKASSHFAFKLDEYWLELKLINKKSPLVESLDPNFSPKDKVITFQEAVNYYLELKGKDRSKGFFQAVNRASKYMIKHLGNNHSINIQR